MSAAAIGDLVLTTAGRRYLAEGGLRQPMVAAVFEADRMPRPDDAETAEAYGIVPASERVLDPAAWVLTEDADGTLVISRPMETWRFESFVGLARGVVLIGPGGQILGAARFPRAGYRIDHPGDVIVAFPEFVLPVPR